MASLRVGRGGGDGKRTARATNARIRRRGRAALPASHTAFVDLLLQPESSKRNATISNFYMFIIIFRSRMLRQASRMLPIDLSSIRVASAAGFPRPDDAC
jgi:hypothetical protein